MATTRTDHLDARRRGTKAKKLKSLGGHMAYGVGTGLWISSTPRKSGIIARSAISAGGLGAYHVRKKRKRGHHG